VRSTNGAGDVLGILYESFTQPLVILSGLPAAGFGPA
jgi:hypothetical protein